MADRSCFWCSKQQLTREHLIPQWLSKKLAGLFPWPDGFELGYTFTTPDGDGELRVHEGRDDQLPQLVVRHVCAECNNGWMSDLEGDAQPILTKLISGAQAQLTVEDQVKIARWSSKTAALLDTYTRYTLVFGETDLDQIRVQHQAPMGWHIRLGYREEKHPQPVVVYVTSHRADPVGANVDPGADELEPNAFSVTLGLGRLAIALVGGPGVDNAARWQQGGDRPLMIWPPSAGGLIWPPLHPRLGTKNDLMQFHEAFWARTLNPDFKRPDVLGRMADRKDP